MVDRDRLCLAAAEHRQVAGRTRAVETAASGEPGRPGGQTTRALVSLVSDGRLVGVVHRRDPHQGEQCPP